MLKTYLPLLFAFVALAMLASCTPKAAPLMGDDGTDWAARAEEYRQNPAALRDFVERCDETQEQYASLRRDYDTNSRQSADLNQRLTTAQAELQQTRDQLAQAQIRQPTEMITDGGQTTGVVFSVQIGAYEQQTVDPNLATGDALDLNNQNGLQKVVVSKFRTYANAVQLRDRLRRMGVKDAFIVASNNGNRIEVPEALRLTGQKQ